MYFWDYRARVSESGSYILMSNETLLDVYTALRPTTLSDVVNVPTSPRLLRTELSVRKGRTRCASALAAAGV